jgi:hypothetical protein
MRLKRDTWLKVVVCLVFVPNVIAAQSLSNAAKAAEKKNSMSSARVGAPILGFLFDPMVQGLRSIVGVPGAATLTEPVDLGLALAYAVVSPRQDFALAVTAEDKRIVAVGLGRPESQVLFIEGVPPDADKIVFGPNGKSAALYYRDDQRVLVLKGLPSAPSTVAAFDISTFEGSLTALALSPAGAAVLAGFSDGETGMLFLLTPGRDPRLLSILRYPGAIRFFSGGGNAVVGDRVSNSIYMVMDVLGSADVVFLASEKDEIATPVDIEVFADDSQILVANEGAGVTSIRLSDRAVQSYPIEGGPDWLQRMNGKSVFLVTDSSRGSTLIFDGDSPEPRIVTVLPSVSPKFQ